MLDRVLDSYATYSYPLGWNRHFRWVIPVAFLGKMKAQFLQQGNHKLEVVKRASWRSRIPASADVQNKATVFCQHPSDFPGKRKKPFQIVGFADVAVLFLEM